MRQGASHGVWSQLIDLFTPFQVDLQRITTSSMLAPASDSCTAAKICRTQPDLVILDLWLQRRGDGWHVFAALQRDPRTRQIPVILCADDPLLLQIEGAGLRDGADAVLEKPFDLAQLLTLIAQLLSGDAQRSPWQALSARLPALALDS